MKNYKYNILFLPYKASMWDTFDSIYKVAVADSRCKVTVISVPYYEKKNKGEEKVIVCENGQYPGYVKETLYTDFSFEEKVDVIFIHNPYDGTNTITQVLPQYYSKELRKYTDHLVYIPYFVTKAGEAMQEHFCQLPAVFYSWRTIVQSKKIRKEYLKYHSAEKIIAMGSPKFDMVKVMCQKKDMLVPDAWKEKLRGKKVFLYNTHLRKIFDGTVIDEIRYVLNSVKNYVNVVVLWRPHPLSMATAEEINMKFAKSYRQLVEEVRELNYVIYDETSDIDRAIALSDAYLGDVESSVVQLYGITGKPIYDIEDWKEDDKKDNSFIHTLGGEIDGSKIWITSVEDNNLYCIDTVTGQLKWHTCFARERSTMQNLYIRSVMDEYNIYFIPCMARSIGVLSKKNKNISYIELPENEENEYTPVLKNQYLWLFPVFYGNAMYKIDLQTRNAEILKSSYRRELEQFKNFGKVPLFGEAKMVQNKIYQVCMVAPVISIYDIEEDRFDYIEVSVETGELVAICSDGKAFWILPGKQGKLIKWEVETNCFYELIYMEDESEDTKQLQFSDIVYKDENIWLVPSAASACIKIELLKGIVKEIGCCKIDDKDVLYDRYKIYDEKIYLFPYKGENICIIDMKTDEVMWLSTRFYGEIKNMGEKDDIRKYIYDQRKCSLEEYIELVVRGGDSFKEERKNSFCKGIENIDKNAGSQIWRYLMQQIDIK